MEQTINKSELVSIRPFKPEDESFIYATWLRGLYHGDTWFSEIPKDVFMKAYHNVIDFMLHKSTAEIRVACLKDDPEVILGYSVFLPDRLHWCFVKKSWRNIGIAKDLIPENINTATHLTKVGLSIVRKKGWTFNPFF